MHSYSCTVTYAQLHMHSYTGHSYTYTCPVTHAQSHMHSHTCTVTHIHLHTTQLLHMHSYTWTVTRTVTHAQLHVNSYTHSNTCTFTHAQMHTTQLHSHYFLCHFSTSKTLAGLSYVFNHPSNSKSLWITLSVLFLFQTSRLLLRFTRP